MLCHSRLLIVLVATACAAPVPVVDVPDGRAKQFPASEGGVALQVPAQGIEEQNGGFEPGNGGNGGSFGGDEEQEQNGRFEPGNGGNGGSFGGDEEQEQNGGFEPGNGGNGGSFGGDEEQEQNGGFDPSNSGNGGSFGGDEEQNGGFQPSNGGNGGSFGGDEEQPTSRSLPTATLPGFHPNVPGLRPVPHVPTSPEHDDVASALFASAALVSGHNELAGVALAAQGHPMAGMAAMMMGDGNEGEHVDAPPPSPPSSPRGLVAAADGFVAAIDSLVGADTDATSRGYVPKMTNTNPGFHLNGPDGIEPSFAFNGVWQPSQQQNGAKCPDVPASMHTLQLAEDSASACQQTCLSYAQYHKFFLGYAGKDFCCQYKEGGAPGECQISRPITATNVPYLPDSEYTAFFFHPTAAANGV